MVQVWDRAEGASFFTILKRWNSEHVIAVSYLFPHDWESILELISLVEEASSVALAHHKRRLLSFAASSKETVEGILDLLIFFFLHRLSSWLLER